MILAILKKSMVKEGYFDMMTFEKYTNAIIRQAKTVFQGRDFEVTQQVSSPGWRSKGSEKK